MKSLLMFAFVLTTTFVSAQTSTEKYIQNLSQKKFGWLVVKQYDSISMLLDDRAQYIHSNGLIQTKEDVIGDMKTGKLVYKNIVVKDSQVRLYDRTAIVVGNGTFGGIMSGTPFTTELRYTEVYIKIPNQWKLASRHANKMP